MKSRLESHKRLAGLVFFLAECNKSSFRFYIERGALNYRINMYSKKITRYQPALIATLLDGSNSMNEERGSSGKSLAAGAMCAVNGDITIVEINPQGVRHN